MRRSRTFHLTVMLAGLTWSAFGISKTPASEPPAALTALPDICSRFATAAESNRLIAASPSQFWRAYPVKVGGETFTLGLDDSGQIQFIHIASMTFKTPDGVDTRWTYEQLQVTFHQNAQCERGWECFVQLPSGWYAGLSGFNLTATASELKPLTTVAFFFRRSYCDEPADEARAQVQPFTRRSSAPGTHLEEGEAVLIARAEASTPDIDLRR